MKKIKNAYQNKRLVILFVAFLLALIFFIPMGILKSFSAHASSIDNAEIVNEISESNKEVKTVLDNNVKDSKILYNYDSSPDYIYVELLGGGYAIFSAYSNELIEYSPYDIDILDDKLDNDSATIIYGGPATYLSAINENKFVDINTDETITIETAEINNLSALSRSLFNDVNTINNRKLSESNYIANIQEKIEQNAPDAVPPLDENNLISPTNGATYIENGNYFFADPTHGSNNGTSCTTVATQLMLSYHNYYNDRRLIPDEYLNGTKTTNPNYNPNYCTDPMLFTSKTLGSNQNYHDYLFQKGVTAFPRDAKNKLDTCLQERNSALNKKLDYTLICEDTYPNALNAGKVLAELGQNRPVVLSTADKLNGTTNSPIRKFNHSVLAYGYQTLAPYSDGTSYLGYVVHFGWSSSRNQIWTNSAWYYTYLSLQINHEHNYYKVGQIANTTRTEYKCSDCGHRTDKAPNHSYLNVTSIQKNGGAWQVRVENLLNTSVTAYYNSKMCFYDDAKNWTGLTDISRIKLSGKSSATITISENAFATSIALSYISNGNRYITFADKLNTNGSLHIMHSSKNVNSYTRQGMKVSLVGKRGGTWLLELTNNTGSGRYFKYNSKMCFEDDAKNWKGLAHQNEIYISNGATELIEISEYGTATSIAISYKDGSSGRYIFYAYNLSTNGTMTSYGTYKAMHYYTYNGIEVAIVEKIGGTWAIELTNNTGKPQKFEYNSRMCFEGDAKNWTGLSHVNEISLQNGETTREPINISEYGTATSITISYMDGIYRKIFYANNLNATTCTMTANGNTKDTTVQDSCLAAGTLITLADGSQKAVEELTGNEMLLVWNMKTGTYDTAPIMFIDSDPIHTNDIINLHFSDETTVKVIYEHGFWDFDLNSYVYLDENAEEYVGHWFNKQTTDAAGNYTWEKVQLTEVTFTQEYTTAWSPVTYGHLCYFVNGMLSMPGGIDGLFNIFEVDSETLTYDTEAMAADIEEYGLFTYEEFYEIYPISEEVFEAFNGEYLKVAIGKGLITYERIGELIERYAEFF